MSSPALWAELENFTTTNRLAGRFFPPGVAQCACVSQQGATLMDSLALKQLTATRSSVSENLVSFERYKRWQLFGDYPF